MTFYNIILTYCHGFYSHNYRLVLEMDFHTMFKVSSWKISEMTKRICGKMRGTCMNTHWSTEKKSIKEDEYEVEEGRSSSLKLFCCPSVAVWWNDMMMVDDGVLLYKLKTDYFVWLRILLTDINNMYECFLLCSIKRFDD